MIHPPFVYWIRSGLTLLFFFTYRPYTFLHPICCPSISCLNISEAVEDQYRKIEVLRPTILTKSIIIIKRVRLRIYLKFKIVFSVMGSGYDPVKGVSGRDSINCPLFMTSLKAVMCMIIMLYFLSLFIHISSIVHEHLVVASMRNRKLWVVLPMHWFHMLSPPWPMVNHLWSL